jgi:hypothetical protein
MSCALYLIEVEHVGLHRPHANHSRHALHLLL